MNVFRAPTLKAQKAIHSPDCVNEMVEYIHNKADKNYITHGADATYNKWKTCTSANVEECLIEVLQFKGFGYLKKESLDNVCKLLYKPFVTRFDYISEITKWINIMIPGKSRSKPYKEGNMETPRKSDLRSLLTPDARLSVIVADTLAAQGNLETYNRRYDASIPCINFKITPTPPYSSSDINDYLDDFSHANIKWGLPNEHYVAVNICHQKCADCWICGLPIHIYYNKTENQALNACGEDEHVLPPGCGNLFGTLGHNYESTTNAIRDLPQALYGILPAHAWCNQCKSGTCFISGPNPDSAIDDEKYKYHIKTTAIDKFKSKAEKWLKYNNHDESDTDDDEDDDEESSSVGADNSSAGAGHSQEGYFTKSKDSGNYRPWLKSASPQKKLSNSEFVNGMVSHMTPVLEFICEKLNLRPTTELLVDNLASYNRYRLRTCFISCLICVEALNYVKSPKWQTLGGEKSTNTHNYYYRGGSTKMDKIIMDLITHINGKCLTEDNITELDSSLDTELTNFNKPMQPMQTRSKIRRENRNVNPYGGSRKLKKGKSQKNSKKKIITPFSHTPF